MPVDSIGRRIVGWLGDCGGCKFNILRALAERRGFDEQALRDGLARLVKAGRIEAYRQQGGLHYRMKGKR